MAHSLDLWPGLSRLVQKSIVGSEWSGPEEGIGLCQRACRLTFEMKLSTCSSNSPTVRYVTTVKPSDESLVIMWGHLSKGFNPGSQ